MDLVVLEGSDLTGKTSALSELSDITGAYVNEGTIYSGEVSSRCVQEGYEANKKNRETLYTLAYMYDRIEHVNQNDNAQNVLLQDWYWPSVISYGQFLLGENSFERVIDFLKLSQELGLKVICSFVDIGKLDEEEVKNFTENLGVDYDIRELE